MPYLLIDEDIKKVLRWFENNVIETHDDPDDHELAKRLYKTIGEEKRYEEVSRW